MLALSDTVSRRTGIGDGRRASRNAWAKSPDQPPNLEAVEEYFVTSSTRLFGNGARIGERFKHIRDAIGQAVAGTPEDEVLSADADVWARGLAEDRAVEPPRVDVEAAELIQHGPVKVNCTNVPGIQYGMNEWGRVIRDGLRFQLNVPGEGELELLRSRLPAGGPDLLAEIEANQVVRTWDWPEVKGAPEFEQEIEGFTNTLRRGAEALAGEITRRNEELIGFAREVIEKRRADILKRRDFLGQIKMPVKRSPDPPKEFGPPPIRPKQTPARKARSAERATTAPGQPHLDEFYDHILDVIRAEARGLERSPGSFAHADEETLRDHMLVTLNTHYVGQTYAEAFNRAGKTDILIRVHDRNAFIGECKWWKGAAALRKALDQLFGYTTWQDSRLALIFYVEAKKISDVIETAKSELEGRPEFVAWEPTREDAELRCRVRWPDDPNRHATLTVVFVHLTPARGN